MERLDIQPDQLPSLLSTTRDPRLTAERILIPNPHSDGVMGEYFYDSNDQKTYPYAEIDSDLARQVVGYGMIGYDLAFCRSLTHEYLNADALNTTIFRGIWMAVIVTYAKCFAESEGRKTRLHADAVFQKDQKLLAIHRAIIDLRNTFVAHSGLTRQEGGHVAIVLNPPEDPRGIKAVEALNFSVRLPEQPRLAEFETVIALAATYATDKLKELNDQLKGEVNSIPLDQLYEASFTPDQLPHVLVSPVSSVPVKAAPPQM
jgi:hypothetical protein